MKPSKKTAIVLTLVSIFLIALAIPSYSWTRTNVSRIEKFYNSKLSPIIMIPGSSATENRFDGLVTKLNQDRQGTIHSLLKVKVWNDGHITYSGSIDAKDNEPVIVVVSALGGITDKLINTSKMAAVGDSAYEGEFREIVYRHVEMIKEVIPAGEKQVSLQRQIGELLNEL